MKSAARRLLLRVPPPWGEEKKYSMERETKTEKRKRKIDFCLGGSTRNETTQFWLLGII